MIRTGRRRALAAAALVVVLLPAACGGGGDDDASSSTSSSSTTIAPSDGALEDVALDTELVATVDTPTALTARPGTHDLYVAEQGGRVRRIEVTETTDGTRAERLIREPVLDLSDRVKSGGEQGLLGIAFSSDGRQLYTYATLEPDGQNWVGAFDIGEGDSVDADSGRDLLAIDDQYPNHNAGQLALGPDGFLYVALGDGGSGGDPDGHGQDTSELLGSVLRIDPEGATTGRDAQPYAIPSGNPFEHSGGKPEIWLYGVRNPWRFSFDRETGDLWIADVGQGEWEELDRLPATDGVDAGRGANLGWDRMEGSHPYDGGSNPSGGVLPVFEYSHADGACAVVGGYVYRGSAIADLDGAYLFTDYCQSGVRALTFRDGAVTGTHTFDLPVQQVQSFGEDADGEVYLLLTSGEVLRLTPG